MIDLYEPASVKSQHQSSKAVLPADTSGTQRAELFVSGCPPTLVSQIPNDVQAHHLDHIHVTTPIDSLVASRETIGERPLKKGQTLAPHSTFEHTFVAQPYTAVYRTAAAKRRRAGTGGQKESLQAGSPRDSPKKECVRCR
jgi:hypothetical protein